MRYFGLVSEQSAWLQSPRQLQYVGDGENCVPTIHVRDLARFVKRVAEQKPESPYIFAIDRTADSRQRAIIEGIAKGMGSGEVEQNEAPKKAPLFALKRAGYNEARTAQASWVHTLQIALKLRPSGLVVKQDEEGKEEDLDFEWHSRDGLAANAKKVGQEYCDVNNLRPIKIYVNGPPLSGKTTLCKEYLKLSTLDWPNVTTSCTSLSPTSHANSSISLPTTGSRRKSMSISRPIPANPTRARYCAKGSNASSSRMPASTGDTSSMASHDLTPRPRPSSIVLSPLSLSRPEEAEEEARGEEGKAARRGREGR